MSLLNVPKQAVFFTKDVAVGTLLTTYKATPDITIAAGTVIRAVYTQNDTARDIWLSFDGINNHFYLNQLVAGDPGIGFDFSHLGLYVVGHIFLKVTPTVSTTGFVFITVMT